MNLKDRILSEENIFLAIYRLKSYINNYDLLCEDDKTTFLDLQDFFDFSKQNEMISKVEKRIQSVIDNKEDFFACKVFLKPKGIDENGNDVIFRPNHVSSISDTIAMVSILQAIIYDLEYASDGIKLSSISEHMPKNFYGNKISTRASELFVDYRIQYKKYVKKSNEYYRNFSESGKYKYEVKLDFKNFFPSIDPMYVYEAILSKTPIYYSDDDKKILKKCLIKLLFLKVENLDKESAKIYYEGQNLIGHSENKYYFTLGIPQGLPQSNFFANFCMLKLKDILGKSIRNNTEECPMIFYVDDIFAYTNADFSNETKFKEKVYFINKELSKEKVDLSITKEFEECYGQEQCPIMMFDYELKIHDEIGDKSYCNKIGKKIVVSIS